MRRMSRPGAWIIPGVLLMLAAGFALLGRWQLSRAEVNRAIETSFFAAQELAALRSPPPDSELEGLRYRRIRLDGRYQDRRQILLDNMTRDGRAGYEVLTPFRIDGDEKLLMVNRGWVPADPDRRILPDVRITDPVASVNGLLDRLPRSALGFGQSDASGESRIAVLSFPEFADVELALGQSVHHAQILLDVDAAAGYRRDWGPPEGLDERNVAYAVQWFGLSALALVLAIGCAWRVARHRGESGA